MTLDVIHPIFEVAKSLGEIHLQKVSQHVPQVVTEVPRETHLQKTSFSTINQ